MALNKKEIEQYKQRLLEQKKQLTHLLEGSSAEVKTPEEGKGYSQHQADEGTADSERSLSIKLTGEEYQVLKLIDRALEKIEEGTYGICDISGSQIPKKRLDAIPYASMTVEAQEKVEKGIIQP